jgi:hypothetical protein
MRGPGRGRAAGLKTYTMKRVTLFCRYKLP